MNPRWPATAAYLGLLLLQPLWHFVLQPPGNLSAGWVTALAMAPLSILLPWILRDRPRAWTGACYIALFYFIHGAVESWASESARGLALTETALALMVFATVNLRLRHPPRSDRTAG
jgi:uncharacterized membrane protein